MSPFSLSLLEEVQIKVLCCICDATNLSAGSNRLRTGQSWEQIRISILWDQLERAGRSHAGTKSLCALYEKFISELIPKAQEEQEAGNGKKPIDLVEKEVDMVNLLGNQGL